MEIADDGWDQDCSGSDAVTCLLDGDGDGWPGTVGVVEEDGECDAGQLPAWYATDCDDADPDVHPFALDPPDDGVDQDCTESDAVSCFLDQDGDGWGAAWLVGEEHCDQPGQVDVGGDCNDLLPSVHPGAPETLSDGIDQDCDGSDAIACFVDADGDGYGGGSPLATPWLLCTSPGHSAFGGDCNDSTATISPAAFDAPDDGVDQDCNGIDAAGCFYDGDGDGWGWWSGVYDADGDCTDDPFQSPYATDCNDAIAAIHPTATDTPDDGVDQDCNGLDAVTCYVDGDGDGFGGAATMVDPDGQCIDDVGQAPIGGDCDDAVDWIHPGAPEIVGDAFDSDCDGDPEN